MSECRVVSFSLYHTVRYAYPAHPACRVPDMDYSANFAARANYPKGDDRSWRPSQSSCVGETNKTLSAAGSIINQDDTIARSSVLYVWTQGTTVRLFGEKERERERERERKRETKCSACYECCDACLACVRWINELLKV